MISEQTHGSESGEQLQVTQQVQSDGSAEQSSCIQKKTTFNEHHI